MNRPSPWRVRVTGPLQAYAAGFREELFGLGYSERSCAGHLQLMTHLSRWLAETGSAPGELQAVQVEQFLQARRAGSRVHRNLTLRGMGPLLDHLRKAGAVPMAGPAPQPEGRELAIAQFVEYLTLERRLAEPTIANYRGVAGRFLAGCGWVPGDLSSLSGESVNAFVLSEAARRSSGSLNAVTTALRALLRFFYLHDHIPVLLADTVPAAPSWRDRGAVRAVTADQVALMLAACDRRTGTSRRDYAVLKLLARLGLRRGEVASLSVGDINWRTGVLTVTGKGSRREVLPLPVDVGEAIAGYCHDGRRKGGSRNLFLSSLAPWDGLSPSGVGDQVCQETADLAERDRDEAAARVFGAVAAVTHR